jgi:carboxymethylenebutenolidase
MPAITLQGDVKAHLAIPPVGTGPWPGVVVLHESFGLNDDIRQQADRLAAAGYLALAPDLFSAGGALRCLRATFRAAMSGRGKAFDDIEAARTWLSARDDCSGRIGVIGFCLGGGFALLTASRGFDASAPNYAHLPKDLDGALARAGVERDVREYPDAGHSFLNRHDLGPGGAILRVAGIGYHEPSAEDAWGRILRFFEAHLRA